LAVGSHDQSLGDLAALTVEEYAGGGLDEPVRLTGVLHLS
jgi:hypothetical protein